MISSIMYRYSVGAVFLLANSQHSADPAQKATCYPAHNATHEAADGLKHLISGARTSTGTMAGTWCDTLSAGVVRALDSLTRRRARHRVDGTDTRKGAAMTGRTAAYGRAPFAWAVTLHDLRRRYRLTAPGRST
jgi:hypothetical protein